MGFVMTLRFILPREVRSAVLSEVIHDMIKGIWHAIFGPRKVRVVRDSNVHVVRDKHEKVLGMKNKKHL